MRGFIAVWAAVLLFPATLAFGQPDFNADAASVLDGEGVPHTYLMLSFRNPDSGLLVEVRFRGKNDLDLERSWVVDAGEVTEGPGGLFTWQRVLDLPPGETRAEIRVQDLESAAKSETTIRFTVPGEDASLSVSDLFFGSCRGEAGEEEGPWSVLAPNPARLFGREAPDLCIWARFVDRAAPDAAVVYKVRFRIRNDRGKTVRQDDLEVPRRDGKGEVLYRPRMEGLTRGRYDVRMEVSLDGEEASADGWFKMDDSQLSIYGDPVKIRETLEIIATNEELLTLEDTPDESLPGFWDAFWALRDPIPETKTNEAMVEFLERVDVATRRFGTLEPGWRTDRGRVYIQLGPPDHEELVGENRDSLLWTYDDRNLSLIFQDVDGFGRYRLVGRRRP